MSRWSTWVTVVALSASLVEAAPDDEVIEVDPADVQRFDNLVDQINLEANTFSSIPSNGGERDWKAWAYQQLDLEIEYLSREVQITAEQTERIRTAFEGELNRFSVLYSNTKKRWKEFDNDALENEGWQLLSSLRTIVHERWLGRRSLFRTSLDDILSPEQIARMKEIERQRSELQLSAFFPMRFFFWMKKFHRSVSSATIPKS
ncbi:hypothetical protein K2X85_08890 [bacterium]|nr:hypothetical protein [bacterium]